VNIGIAQTKLQRYKDAQHYLNKGLEISKDIGSRKLIQLCYKWMANLNNQLAAADDAPINKRETYSLKALEYTNLYNELSDSIK
jgi:hypothetical protein